jgi:hypothetical protein
MKRRTTKAVMAEWRRDARFLAKAEPFSPEATILLAGMQRLKREYDRLLESASNDRDDRDALAPEILREREN